MLSVEARSETILALACAFLSSPAAAEAPKKGHSRAIEPVPACEALRKDRRFNVLFERVDVEKLVQTAADVTCHTFIVPDNIKGKISIIGPDKGQGEISADQFYSAFLAALDANGLTILRSGAFFRIIEKSRANKSAIETVVDSNEIHQTNGEMVTRLFQLRNAELEPIRAVLAQLISPGAEMVPFPPDTLIVTEVGSNLQRIEKLVAQLDVAPADQLRVIQVKFASVQDVADKIQRILDKSRGAGAKPPSTGHLVVPDERTNKLIVLSNPATVDRILELLADLDVPLPGDGQVSVYLLKNAEAKEVAAALEPLLQGAHPKQPAPPNVPPPPVAQPPASLPGGQMAAALFTGEVKVSASEATNGLVVVANPADYRSLVRIIEQLDTPRKQVFIETAILEVDVERDSDFGVSFHDVATVNTSQGSVPILLGTNYPGEPSSLSLTSLLSTNGALAAVQGPILKDLSNQLGVNIPQFGLILHALQQSSDVNVISTPHLLVMDNKEAQIHVGQKVPFQTGYTPAALQQAQSAGVNTTVNSLSQLYAPISRENVELKLIVKPHVGEGDEVRLDIEEQTEEIVSTDKVLGPTTSTRGTKTTIVGQDHRTIVLGGIMEDRVLESVSKTPILGDVPLLGYLFRSTTKRKVKTNLLLFLTPHIIRNRADFEAISERKTRERQKLLEEFWGERGAGEPPVDFTHKRGPVAAMTAAIRREENRPENGGPGNPGEHVVRPSVSPADSSGTGESR
jgi:general secretion pathway protein D